MTRQMALGVVSSVVDCLVAVCSSSVVYVQPTGCRFWRSWMAWVGERCDDLSTFRRRWTWHSTTALDSWSNCWRSQSTPSRKSVIFSTFLSKNWTQRVCRSVPGVVCCGFMCTAVCFHILSVDLFEHRPSPAMLWVGAKQWLDCGNSHITGVYPGMSHVWASDIMHPLFISWFWCYIHCLLVSLSSQLTSFFFTYFSLLVYFLSCLFV